MDKLSKLRGIAASCEGSEGTINLSREDAAVVGLEGEPVEGTDSVEVPCEDLVNAVYLADLEEAEDALDESEAKTAAKSAKPTKTSAKLQPKKSANLGKIGSKNKGDSGTPSNRATGNPTGPSAADHEEE